MIAHANSTYSNWPFGTLQRKKASKAEKRIAKWDFSKYSSSALVQQELKRYFLIRLRLKRKITMQSDSIDRAWHAFILDTKNYVKFSKAVFGKYLHHKSAHYELDQEFPEVYRKLFGENLPYVWFDMAGSDNCA